MSREPTVTILADFAALVEAAADHLVEVLRDTLDARPVAHIALAGGSTPRAMNALLVTSARDALDWKRVVFWFGDERCVPPDDPDSNYRMNRETLLDPLHIAPDHVHRIHGEDDPTAAAADYATVLQRELGEQPRLDLVMLGMGPEGHTASLFPGTLAGIGSELVVAHYVPKLDRWRITLTPRVINAAHHVTITAGGAEKADALYAVLDGAREPDIYPSQIVRPTHGELHWFVDTAAAAKHLAAAT
jgi:6-phosphogluconolactonase